MAALLTLRIYSPSELTQRSMTNVRADDGSAASGLGEEKLANEEDISYLNGSRRVLIIRDNRLYRRLEPNQVPVVYSPSYNIGFMGLEKLHPFDSQKWGNVYKLLIESGRLDPDGVVEPLEASKADLEMVHTRSYLNSLHIPCVLARIIEVAVVALIPSCISDRKLLRPMRYQTGGTILAARLALEYGWAVNVGGGFHHASAKSGGGFCVYADITLAVRFLFLGCFIRRAMIIDLDAHQGNGHERDFKGDDSVYIMDVFNAEIYPHDREAREAIRKAVPLKSGVSRAEYIYRLDRELGEAFAEFQPDLVVYNAGTDCLCHDPLGAMNLSSEAIVERDEMVFDASRSRGIPIVMVTSGGYSRESAKVIASSILNLDAKRLVQLRRGDPTAVAAATTTAA